ncbi:MAG: PorT family protein [Flavobacteriaceae bacterium]|nr:PorT family protein [Flavobacteriaceae bacterium]
MSLKNLLFVTLTFLFIQNSFSQRNFDHYNRLGLTGGYSLYDINTSDLNTKQGNGFMAGFTTRGAFRNNFDLIYGLSFYSNKVEIFGRDANNSFETQFIDYKIQGVQINFLGSYNIIKHHLSIEFGPILNISGKLKVDQEQFEEYILDGYDSLKAVDIEEISPINLHLMGGISGGMETFRVSVQYQYGVFNMLNKLNDKNLENTNFEGNSSTIIFSLFVYF